MNKKDLEKLLLTEKEQDDALNIAEEKYRTEFVLGDVRTIHKVILQAQLSKVIKALTEETDKPDTNMPILRFFIGAVWETPNELVEVEWLCIPSSGGTGCYLIAYNANGQWRHVPEKRHVAYSGMEGKWVKAFVPEVKEGKDVI